jgi:hypothetical protein
VKIRKASSAAPRGAAANEMLKIALASGFPLGTGRARIATAGAAIGADALSADYRRSTVGKSIMIRIFAMYRRSTDRTGWTGALRFRTDGARLTWATAMHCDRRSTD